MIGYRWRNENSIMSVHVWITWCGYLEGSIRSWICGVVPLRVDKVEADDSGIP